MSGATIMAIDLPTEVATAALAGRLIRRLTSGDLVGLSGALGAGKTTFARAAIRALLGPDAEVPSPTFTLAQTYALPAGMLWHFDLYRLTSPDDVIELGWDDACADGIVMVEWPDRLGALLPADRLDIDLAFAGSGEARTATLTGHGAWADRIGDLG